VKIQALTRKEQDLHDWEKLISAETRLVTGNVQENVPPQAYLEKEARASMSAQYYAWSSFEHLGKVLVQPCLGMLAVVVTPGRVDETAEWLELALSRRAAIGDRDTNHITNAGVMEIRQCGIV
jgi:hypothetical protein